jgi:hypothetical protein
MKQSTFSAIRIISFFVFSFCAVPLYGQKVKDVFVDKEGVMRWGDSKKEVQGFGINYTTPFAHAYRSGKKLDVDLEKAIEDDVYHFARLGFDAFRVHVWDTEISDSLGNLLENDHLRLFDFMLTKMKERGMKIFLTPIAFWGNGYPERDEKTPGFASKYGKDACLVNPDAIAAQERYLFQFLNHVNPYTKVAYKDDPDIVGFEVSNEPHHKGTRDEVKAYINRMVAAMRKTGCKKPILYNVSHSIHRSDAYFDSNIDGGTFQWYPTGLGAAHELRGNFLPNVDRYTIPFVADPKFKKMAKIVYEFDAADVGKSYIYPAMARSFREAGIQWATHFAYDPTFLAYANTEYNTHYMNLVYAPQKALSLKLASEVFHAVPRYKKYGSYPGNIRFENFRVSYEEDLAELATDKKFIYTNTTATVPPNPKTLEEINGYGNSVVVKYEGRGAYFLDKIENGVWRLEVLPDAIWVDNVFGRNNLQKTVAVINWRQWPIAINLADLGENFKAKAITGDIKDITVSGQTFDVKPGVFLLTRAGVTAEIENTRRWKNIRLNEFAAPLTTLTKRYVLHTPLITAAAGELVKVDASVVTSESPQQVMLSVNTSGRRQEIEMKKVSGYEYTASIPAEFVKAGYLTYYIVIKSKDGTETFPSGVKGTPSDWGFDYTQWYRVPVVPAKSALYLFSAVADAQEVSREWRRGSELLPTEDPTRAEMMVQVPKLFVKDPEFENAPAIYDYSLRYNFQPKIAGRTNGLSDFTKLVFRGRSIDKSFPIQVAVVDKNGNAFGGLIELSPSTGEYSVRIEDLRQVRLVTLPRPYPTFLPYYFEGREQQVLNLNMIETLQISVGPGLKDVDSPYAFTIESIRLE